MSTPFASASDSSERAGAEHPTQRTAERDAALWTAIHG